MGSFLFFSFSGTSVFEDFVGCGLGLRIDPPEFECLVDLKREFLMSLMCIKIRCFKNKNKTIVNSL